MLKRLEGVEPTFSARRLADEDKIRRADARRLRNFIPTVDVYVHSTSIANGQPVNLGATGSKTGGGAKKKKKKKPSFGEHRQRKKAAALREPVRPAKPQSRGPAGNHRSNRPRARGGASREPFSS